MNWFEHENWSRESNSQPTLQSESCNRDPTALSSLRICNRIQNRCFFRGNCARRFLEATLLLPTRLQVTIQVS